MLPNCFATSKIVLPWQHLGITQLVYDLLGSMSIVDARPQARAVNEKYRRLIPSHLFRHKNPTWYYGIRPGPRRGNRSVDDLDSVTKRVECDLAYLRSWSFGLDLKIIAPMLIRICTDRHAFYRGGVSASAARKIDSDRSNS